MIQQSLFSYYIYIIIYLLGPIAPTQSIQEICDNHELDSQLSDLLGKFPNCH